MIYNICVKTSNKESIWFYDINLIEGKQYADRGMTLKTSPKKEAVKVSITAKDETLVPECIIHEIIIDGESFEFIFMNDSSKGCLNEIELSNISEMQQLINISNIFTPVVMFADKERFARFAFGIIGHLFDGSVAIRKIIDDNADNIDDVNVANINEKVKIKITISRGFEGKTIPFEFLSENSSISDYVYIRKYEEYNNKTPWQHMFIEYSNIYKKAFAADAFADTAALEPLWNGYYCLNNDAEKDAVLEQVCNGINLGITNYVIGKESFFSSTLDDLAKISLGIKDLGGRSIIRAKPIAVKCEDADSGKIGDIKKYLAGDEKGNKYIVGDVGDKSYVVCIKNKKAREIITDSVERVFEICGADGIKIEMYEYLKGVFLASGCSSNEHSHDTESEFVALRKLIKSIYKRLKELNSDCLIDVEHNLGGSNISAYCDTISPATKYDERKNENIDENNSEFNNYEYNNSNIFNLMSNIQMYFPKALNNYVELPQNEDDTIWAVNILKMMALGIPSYSIDLQHVSPSQLSIMKNYNFWYFERLTEFLNQRIPLDPKGAVWRIEGDFCNYYFVLDVIERVNIIAEYSFVIFNATFSDIINIGFQNERSVSISCLDCMGNVYKREEFDNTKEIQAKITVGGRIEGEFIG